MDTLWRDKLKHREINDTISKTVNKMTRGTIPEILEVDEEARTTSSLDDQHSMRNKLFPNDSIRESETTNQVADLPGSIYSNPEQGSEGRVEPPRPPPGQKISSFDYFVEEEFDAHSHRSKARASPKQIKSLEITTGQAKRPGIAHANAMKNLKITQSGCEAQVQEGFSKIKISFLSQEEQEAQKDKALAQGPAPEEEPSEETTLGQNVFFQETWAREKPGEEAHPKSGAGRLQARRLEKSELVEEADFDQNCFIKLPTDNDVDFGSSQHSDSLTPPLALLDSPPTIKLESNTKRRTTLFKENACVGSKTETEANFLDIPRIEISGSPSNDEARVEHPRTNGKSRSAEPKKAKFSLKKFSTEIPKEGSGKCNRRRADLDSERRAGRFGGEEKERSFARGVSHERLSKSYFEGKRGHNALGKINQKAIFKRPRLAMKAQRKSIGKQRALAGQKEALNQLVAERLEQKSRRSGGNLQKKGERAVRDRKIRKEKKALTDASIQKGKALFERKRNTFTRKTKSKKLNFYSSFQVRSRTSKTQHFRGKTFIGRKSESQRLKQLQSLRFYPNLEKSVSPNHSKFLREMDARRPRSRGRLRLDTKAPQAPVKVKAVTKTCKHRPIDRSHNSHDFLLRGNPREVFSEVNNYFGATPATQPAQPSKADLVRALARESKETGARPPRLDEYNWAPEALRVSISLDQKAARPRSHKTNLFKTINVSPAGSLVNFNRSFESFLKKNRGRHQKIASGEKVSQGALFRNYQSAQNIVKGGDSGYFHRIEHLISSSKKVRAGRPEPPKNASLGAQGLQRAQRWRKAPSKDLKLKTTFNTFKKQFKQEFYDSGKAATHKGAFKPKKRPPPAQNLSRDLGRVKTEF